MLIADQVSGFLVEGNTRNCSPLIVELLQADVAGIGLGLLLRGSIADVKDDLRVEIQRLGSTWQSLGLHGL